MSDRLLSLEGWRGLPWRLSPCLAAVAALLLLQSGCGDSPVPVDEVRQNETSPAKKPLADAEPVEKFLTADDMRSALGATKEAQFERAGRKFISAFLANTGVKSLEPLAGQPLRRLDLSRNPVVDLAPLKGMSLEQVSLYETQVTDLTVFSGMPLEVLDLTKTPVENLTPLTGSKTLKHLFLEGGKVADLTPLKDVPLEVLYLNECPVTDLAPLAGKSFQELNLCDTQIQNLQGLQGVEMGILWIRNTSVTDLSPIKGSGLVSLDIQGSAVADLAPLAELGTLQRLNIADSQVTDLRPLATLPLQRLIFTPDKIVEGIDMIRQMATLRELDISFEGQATPLAPAEFWAKYDAGEFQKSSAEQPE